MSKRRQDAVIEAEAKLAVNQVLAVQIGQAALNMRPELRKAFPFGPRATEREREIWEGTVKQAMEMIHAWPKTLSAVLVALFLTVGCPCWADEVQRIEPVYVATIGDQSWNITELLHVKRDKINPLNILRLKRGKLYHEYKVLNNKVPVRFYKDKYQVLAPMLKGVPDNRTWQEKHPNVTPAIQLIDLGFTIFGWTQ